LLRHQHEGRGEAWNDSVTAVQTLEHAARIVPSAVTAYGTRDVPQAAQAQVETGQPIILSPAVQGRPGAVIFTPTSSTPTILSPVQPQVPQAAIPAPVRTHSAGSTPALDGLQENGASGASEQPAETPKPSVKTAVQENETP